jgi:hypothetical protein
MDPRFRGPIFAYGHEPRVGPTTGCAITGGAFYNPDTRQFPADYVGDYFFADLCGEWMRRFDLSTGSATDFVSGRQLIVDVVVSNDGSVYYLTYGTGGVYRITAVPTAARIGSVTARRNRTAAAISRDCTIPARHQLDVREQNRRFVRVDESEREFSGPIPTRLPLRGVAPSTRPSCIGST